MYSKGNDGSEDGLRVIRELPGPGFGGKSYSGAEKKI